MPSADIRPTDLGKKTLLGEDGRSHPARASDNYKRKSDSPADNLLVHLTKRLKEEDGTFKPIKEFEDLTKQRKLVMLRDAESSGNHQWKSFFGHEHATTKFSVIVTHTFPHHTS
jgi:hypothetical protein